MLRLAARPSTSKNSPPYKRSRGETAVDELAFAEDVVKASPVEKWENMAGALDGVTPDVGASDRGVTSGHLVGDNPYGIGFNNYVGYRPSATDVYSELDAFALREAFRPRCYCCDFGFLRPLLKAPKGVECVAATL